jgi:hypothetical protein
MRTNQRLARLWLDALATKLGVSAGTIDTYTDDLNCYLGWLDENSLGLDMAGREGDVHQDKANDLPAELVHGALTDHYRKTLDEPIPALGDLRPRAAAQTAAGRRKVVDWLKHLENQTKSGRQPDNSMASYDFTWLWRDLGLERLRR